MQQFQKKPKQPRRGGKLHQIQQGREQRQGQQCSVKRVTKDTQRQWILHTTVCVNEEGATAGSLEMKLEMSRQREPTTKVPPRHDSLDVKIEMSRL